MNTVILAAGMGKRLMPLTAEKPKCMIDFVGVPLLHRQIATLQSVGVDKIVVVGGYKSDQINGDFDHLEVNHKFTSTNMVSTLFCALDHMYDGGDLIISYGDIIYEPRVVKALLECNAQVSTVIDLKWRRYWEMRTDNPLDDAETLRLRDGKFIIELGGEPNGYDDIQGQYIGLTKVRKNYVHNFIEHWKKLDSSFSDRASIDNMYMTSFLQCIIDSGTPIEAAFIENGWLEFDTIQDLVVYEKRYKKNKLNEFMDIGA